MKTSTFWQEHQTDLSTVEYQLAFQKETSRIQAVNRIVTQLSEALELAGRKKSRIARSAGQAESAVRRLFSNTNEANPTLGTIESLANQLGLRVTLEEIPVSESIDPQIANGLMSQGVRRL